MSAADASADGLDPDATLESVFLLAIVAWSVYVIVESLGFDAYFAWILPMVVAVPMLAVTALQLASLHSATLGDLLGRIRLDETSNIDEANPASSGRDVALFVGLTLGYVLLAQLLGFFLAMPVFLFTYFRAYDSFGRRRAAAITVAVWFAVSFVFGTVFAVPGLDFGPFSAVELDLF